MPRYWTCRKCGHKNERRFAKCQGSTSAKAKSDVCTGKRPAPRRPKHTKALDLPYEAWVERFGERCGICGREPSERRKLDRDHWHDSSASPRGLLCHRCNRALPNWIDAQWLRKAADYLDASIGTR